jgi:uncharacterized membrane protein
MNSGRLEAFSDGVLAIIITIMVLELKVPEGSSFEDLKPLIPKFLSYVLSFIYVGIYWNNHHHMFQATEKVNGKILWSNLSLLFTLSLIPFTTAWMGENHFETNPVALYGINLFCCAVTYAVLERYCIKIQGTESALHLALRNKTKEILSPVLYILGIISAFFYPFAGMVFYTIVAVIWLIPDTRIEKQLK